jgi:hypothetical protein
MWLPISLCRVATRSQSDPRDSDLTCFHLPSETMFMLMLVHLKAQVNMLEGRNPRQTNGSVDCKA